MEFRLLIISFMDRVFGGISKKVSPHPTESRFSLMLSSRSFIVLHFTFRSMIQFKLIFVKGVRSVYSFSFLYVYVQLFQHQLLKRLPCSIVLPLFFCQRSVNYKGQFLGTLFCYIDLFVYSFANTTLT